MNAAAIIHINPETSFDLRCAILIATKVTIPAPIPFVIEYVNGIKMIVKNEGIAIA